MTTKLTYGNPYTHEDRTRESISQPGLLGLCRRCGQPRKVLFRYDGTRGYFCNLSCWRSYHN